jgi:hypothetical protein
MRAFWFVSAVCLAFTLVACDRKPDSAPDKPVAKSNDNHGHQPGDTDNHDDHGGPVIELGETTVEGVRVKASRDQGEVKPGGDAPVDAWIDGGLGNATAVRFWIGVEDAKGSVKAKAAVEDGKWHAHVEVPDPLPEGSKLWIEIELPADKRLLASFDLKR